MSEMTTRKQQSVEVQDTEQQAEVAEAGSGSTAVDTIQRTATKFHEGISDDDTRLFSESTNQYLIYYRTDRNINSFLIALFVFALQFSLFVFMAREARAQLQEYNVPLVTSADRCADNQEDEPAYEGQSSDLVCARNVKKERGASTQITVLSSCVLMSCFLLEDMVSCLKILTSASRRWPKVWAMLILFLNLLAFAGGCYFALEGGLYGSSYDALTNCVGILFVSDIDEKVFGALRVIDMFDITGGCARKYTRFTCTVCCFLVMMILGIVCASTGFLGADPAGEIDCIDEDGNEIACDDDL